ncbi:MAG: TIGR00269 family protein [Methanomicrobiales archaeon]|nr:TIGR00269 family protein [Methanomicrobiales archaeon]
MSLTGGGRAACSRCGAAAVYLQRTTGRHLCAGHLAEEVEARARKTMADDGGMPFAGSRVAVALSGGKDSTVLLSILHGIAREMRDLDLVAVTVDEGIAGYREETLRAAAAMAARYSIPHRTASFAELFGDSLDRRVEGQEDRACSLCGILRRKALTVLAREEGAVCIATGHNLDDEAQSVLMNWLRGDRDRLLRDPLQHAARGFVARCKPLREILEKEVALYGMVTGLFSPMPECPYRHTALRSEARAMLNAMEQRYPGTMERVVQGQRRLARVAKERVPAPPGHCARCGDPSSGRICQACQVLEERVFRTARRR